MFKLLCKLVSVLINFTSFMLHFNLNYKINAIFQTQADRENKKITNFFVLGDSLSDPGNLLGLIKNIADHFSLFFGNKLCPEFLKNLIMTYQENILPDQYYKNRFTNSLVFSEITASRLNIESKQAWSCSTFIANRFTCHWVKMLIAKINVFECGNNYALANAKAAKNDNLYQNSIEKIKKQIWKTIFFQSSYQQLWNLTEQLDAVINNFLSLNNQTDILIKQHQIKANDLFFICIGSNDIMDIDDITNQQQVDKTIFDALDGLKYSIKKLILNQAKRIIVTNVVDVGKIPARLNYFSDHYSQASYLYNERWEMMIEQLQQEYPLIMIQKFDLNKLFIHYSQVYANQGKNITSSFVSYGEQDFFTILSGKKVNDAYNLENNQQGKYFFFDRVHPTKEVHELIAYELLKIIDDN